MSADELKQRGNEAFKRNDFKLACELFTEAITLDSTNHVLYSNRSAARVILVVYLFLCIQTVVYIFEAFFDRLHLCLRRLLFLAEKNEEAVVFARPPNAKLFLLLLSFSSSFTIKIAFVFVLVRNNKTRTKDGLMR